MPALNRPFGLSPFRNLIATEHTAAVQRYRIPQADPSAYYIGDVVIQAVGADALGVPNVAKNTGAQPIRGILVGVESPTAGGVSLQGTVIDDTITSVPASKTRDYYVWIVDDPATIFMVQDDGQGAALIATSANKNASLTVAAPALGYQLSATTISGASIATGAGLNIKLMGLAQIPVLPGNVPNSFGTFAVWVAKANLHELANGTAGI